MPLCVWQVGAHDAEGARTRVVNEVLSAVRGACEACVRQEKEERDTILANIQQAKVRALSPLCAFSQPCFCMPAVPLRFSCEALLGDL